MIRQLVAGFGVTSFRGIERTDSEQLDTLAALLAYETRPSDGMILFSDLTRTSIEAALAQIDHGSMPRILNIERPFGPLLRNYAQTPATCTFSRNIVDDERVWIVTLGVAEGPSTIDANLAPLATN